MTSRDVSIVVVTMLPCASIRPRCTSWFAVVSYAARTVSRADCADESASAEILPAEALSVDVEFPSLEHPAPNSTAEAAITAPAVRRRVDTNMLELPPGCVERSFGAPARDTIAPRLRRFHPGVGTANRVVGTIIRPDRLKAPITRSLRGRQPTP
ncbi:MAG: hypothetical protein WAX14_19650 [Rhodococcus sp. (in: high G+C Gram-positive bacteria)]|uniref:hypothetical protein n=1 Tax=Rhodococcus sp. TaxID=1831 RepID=UPI003BB6BEC4